MIVIGLTGLARAGKDSVADILVRDHGFVKMSFAAPLKRMVRNLDPIVGFEVHSCPDDCCEDYDAIYLSDLYDHGMTDDDIKASEYGAEARRLWQRFGTDVMRAEDEEYWLAAAWRDVERSGADRIVFPDVRFPNEADFIRDIGADVPLAWAGPLETAPKVWNYSSVWQIVRPGVEHKEGEHVSEQNVGLMGEEITIHNDGTLVDLAEPVCTALRIVLGEDLPAEGWVQELFGGVN